VDTGRKAKVMTCTEVRKGRRQAKTYLELAKKIAELQFMNRDYVLLFRKRTLGWGVGVLRYVDTGYGPVRVFC
jgi:hypothetical protein